MRYGSVCSGIEAATAAWHDLGWKPSFFSEIEAFPRAILKHHYPDTPLHGDFTTIKGNDYEPIELLVGGTPCQSFSIAGLRGGLADDRGNLALEFLRLADRTRPRWLVWENVPGVLSSNGGRDFGSILGGMGELGYGWAYRVLDAQYFGVAQRRRRVFVVGYLGDWRHASAVLFERHSLQGHSAPRREKGERPAPTIAGCANGGGANGPGRDVDSVESLIPFISHTLNAHGGSCGRLDFESETFGADRGMDVVAFQSSQSGVREVKTHATLDANNGSRRHNGVSTMSGVRRLTPRECERLQGFRDDFSAIPWRGKPAAECPDGPRYKALGNSMAVPVMRWIGQRIQMVDNIS